jgi:2-polyprenyl-3-methyl-5-hydroxy-6-metoxy-1,4-benzoquinol methylase
MSDSVVSIPAARVHVGVVPEWNLDDLVTRGCPVCGEDDSETVCRRPDGLDVESCRNCEMLFVARIPSEHQLAAFYSTYASHKGYSKGQPRSWLARVAACAQDLYIEALEQTGGLFGRSVLEIGCSTGNFLELVAFKGGRPAGVEIDTRAREEAESRGFSVSSILPSSGQYDVTCAFQVIEHLAKPGEMLGVMRSLTKPEGRVILGVPNAAEFSRLGRDWLGFRVDLEHFNYFTIKTLASLLRRHGLLVEHFWEHRQPHVVRTDIESVPGPSTRGARLRARIDREAVALLRALRPPPERFLEGTFVLSLLARPA